MHGRRRIRATPPLIVLVALVTAWILSSSHAEAQSRAASSAESCSAKPCGRAEAFGLVQRFVRGLIDPDADSEPGLRGLVGSAQQNNISKWRARLEPASDILEVFRGGVEKRYYEAYYLVVRNDDGSLPLVSVSAFYDPEGTPVFAITGYSDSRPSDPFKQRLLAAGRTGKSPTPSPASPSPVAGPGDEGGPEPVHPAYTVL